VPDTFDDNGVPDSAEVEAWQDQIDALRDLAKKELTRWELDFLESIDDFLKERGFLTPKQAETLASIHEKHLGG